MYEMRSYGQTNFVRTNDLVALTESLRPFPLAVGESLDAPGMVRINTTDPEKGWLFEVYAADGSEIDFSVSEHIMPFIAEGELLIISDVSLSPEWGISVHQDAFVRNGKEIRHLQTEPLKESAAALCKKAGVDPDAAISRSDNNSLPHYLHTAIGGTRAEFAQMMEDGFNWKDREAALLRALAHGGHTENLEELISRGASIDSPHLLEGAKGSAKTQAWLATQRMNDSIASDDYTALQPRIMRGRAL